MMLIDQTTSAELQERAVDFNNSHREERPSIPRTNMYEINFVTIVVAISDEISCKEQNSSRNNRFSKRQATA